MYTLAIALAALFAQVNHAVAVPAPVAAATSASAATAAASAAISGNPFSGYQLYANPYYASEVSSIAIPSLSAEGSTSLIPKATAAAEVPSFVWLYDSLLLLSIWN